jgi:hypothetical protein
MSHRITPRISRPSERSTRLRTPEDVDRDMYDDRHQKEIATENDKLAQVPGEEREELVLICQSKGMHRPGRGVRLVRRLSDLAIDVPLCTAEHLGSQS